MSYEDFDDEGDITDLYDDEDDDAADCNQFLDGGVIVCGAAGSEWCDFECPLRRDLGLTPKEAEQRAIDEITEENRALTAAQCAPWFDGSSFDIHDGVEK